MGDLFSYCIPIDDGAAPNPFWGVCTLVICKPAIRRKAQVGDWIVGTGSKHSPLGDITSKVVYAMCVTEKMTMAKYNLHTIRELPGKIPDWHSSDWRQRVGDSIYDFTVWPTGIRQSVHDERNRERDLRGQYALLSKQFFYFGDHPVELPAHLRGIIKAGQGHRHIREEVTVSEFVRWLEELDYRVNVLHGEPQEQSEEKRCIIDEEDDDSE